MSVYLPEAIFKAMDFASFEMVVFIFCYNDTSTRSTNIYCYNEAQKQEALRKLGKRALVTRFKGLGEISPEQFKDWISEENIKLDPIRLRKEDNLSSLLMFYMGKNTPERQSFIIDNLVMDE